MNRDHNGGETAVDAALAKLERVAVVKVYADGQLSFNFGCFNKLHEICVVGIFPCACADLKNERCVFFFCSFGNSLDDLHVVNVECADGVSAVIGLFEHFGAGYEWHSGILLTNLFIVS